MKKMTKIILFALASISLVACMKDQTLVTYPKSYPVFSKAQVAESTITYGDSISIAVNISDNITPLSTLEIQVVVNNEVDTSQSIRTKGNSVELNKKYPVPFVANRPDNAKVKVYLSSINVDGWTTDTIISTTIAKRPIINEIWFVPTSGQTYKLNLTDAANLIYYTGGMNFGTTVSYRLATKIDKFKKVDWSGLVFGKVGDGVGLIDQSGDPITSTDATLVGISEITFDALKFEVKVGGKLLEPITTLDINTDLSPIVMGGNNFLGGNAYLGEGVEVTFTGLTDLTNSLAPDYFEVTGTNTAKFLGKTALYRAYYYSAGNYLYIEPQTTVIYPDALWLCGTGFGRPSTPYVTTASWNWNSSFDYAPCRLVSTGVYQVTVYLSNADKGGTSAGYGTFDCKFFYQRGWGSETEANTYTITPSPFFGRTDTGNVGNLNGGSTTFDGVYRITIDMNAKTINLVKVN
jgi:hypothetical protein